MAVLREWGLQIEAEVKGEPEDEELQQEEQKRSEEDRDQVAKMRVVSSVSIARGSVLPNLQSWHFPFL